MLDPNTPPLLGVSQFDIFQRFANAYQTRAGTAFLFGSSWDQGHLQGALADVFPLDEQARAWLAQALNTIDDLYAIADIGVTAVANQPDLRFSIMEALFARGFTDANAIAFDSVVRNQPYSCATP